MRREILDTARATGFEGSILDLYQMAVQGANVPEMLQAEAQAKQQNMLVAQTPQEQQVGLREQHAMGNTGASMAFPDVAPNTSFNTEGMKVPINISKMDEQGHLVQSYQNVPPGIKNLPTGPKRGTVIETPAYQGGGFKDKLEVITSAAGAGEPLYTGMGRGARPFEGTAGQNLVDYLGRVVEKPKYYKGMVKAARDAAKGDEFAKKVLRRFYRREKGKVKDVIREGKRFGKDIYKVLKPFAKSAGSFTTVLPVDVSKDASDMPALYGTGAAGDPYTPKIDYNKIYKKGGYRPKYIR